MIAAPTVIDLHTSVDAGGENGVLLGHKGTGKSTLGTHLCRRFLRTYPDSYLLIIDSKPRFRATWKPNGLPLRYRGWVAGDTFDGAVALSERNVDLRNAWGVSRVAIFQSMTDRAKSFEDWRRRTGEYCQKAFEFSRPDRPVMVYFDEMYDEVSGLSGFADARVLKIIRAGRERGLSCLIAAQRPKSIPLFSLTEADNFYLFFLQSEEDRKYIGKYGPPLTKTPQGHQFVFYRQYLGGEHQEFLTQITLEGKAA